MRVLQINSFFSVGGPPRIVKGIYDTLIEQGHDCVVAAGRENPIEGMKIIKIGTPINKYLHLFMSRVFDAQGLSSKIATRRLLKKIDDYNPDIIHLHNLHGYYINIEILFDYLKRVNKPVVWTLHDCWAFTGHCSHFDYIKCEKWKTGCFECPQKKEYPTCNVFDNSRRNYEKKKNAFSGIKNLAIVTPSKWLGGKVKESFLGQYHIEVIPNGIDLNLFRPVESEFKNQYSIEDKIVVLGVAQNWSVKKGLYDFIELSKKIDEQFQIVLVGLTGDQIKALPRNIIGIGRTNSADELAKIYSAADIFLNPSVEETMGLTTVEALACGTPAIVSSATAVPEVIDETCGLIVNNGYYETIIYAIETNFLDADIMKNCRKKAESFDCSKRYMEYIDMYRNLLN